MTDVAVIILTKNEKLHIGRCLERVAALSPRQVFVVDCLSDDGTQEIITDTSASLRLCVKIAEHEWPGLYAVQFNWALDNLPIETKWVLRLDADEYLTSETIERLKNELPKLPDDVSGLTLELKRRFMGGEIRHGTNGIRLLRIFKYGIGRCEERAMDEHIVLSKGRCIDFDGAFYDDNLNTFEWWQEKHRGYAKREAMDAISLFNNPERLKHAPCALEEDECVVVCCRACEEVKRNVLACGCVVDQVLALCRADCEAVKGYIVVNCVCSRNEAVICDNLYARILCLLNCSRCCRTVLCADDQDLHVLGDQSLNIGLLCCG